MRREMDGFGKDNKWRINKKRGNTVWKKGMRAEKGLAGEIKGVNGWELLCGLRNGRASKGRWRK